jgi:hypothetical protein
MYDRQTFTLWGNLTGEPVVGKMAAGNARLRILPMTLTTWKEWKNRYPQTNVLYLDPDYGKQWNFRYEPRLADREREGVTFPVWQKSKLLPQKEEVYVMRINGVPKAYSIKSLLKQRILNDRVSGVSVLLIIDPESQSIRAYRSENRTFSLAPSGKELRDQAGSVWSIQEDLLTSKEGATLHRFPGHLSLWFAWFGFFPGTELWAPGRN